MVSRRGALFVLSAPSGAGKTTLCQKLLAQYSNLSYSISYTTRAPRQGEENGRDYFFISKQEFEQMISKGDFLEYAEVHGNLYGTALSQIVQSIENGKDILLDIDVQGAIALRERLGSTSSNLEATFIFITAPSFDDLRSRLERRGSESKDIIALRLENAVKEVEAYKYYDYIIVNDDLEQAYTELDMLYRVEMLRVRNFPSIEDFMKLDKK